MQSIQEFIDRQLQANDLTREGLWWGILIFALLFAFAHLLTMLITRWGDHKATSKSLIFSLLAHLVLGIALLLMKPPSISIANDIDEKLPMKIRDIYVDGEDQMEKRASGNTPIWKKPPEKVNVELARTDPVPLEVNPLQSPDRQDQPIDKPDITPPDMKSLPDQQAVIPKVENAGEVAPRVEAVTPLKIDTPEPESRPQVVIPSLTNRRTKQMRDGEQKQSVERRPTRGAIDHIETKPTPPKQLASIDAPKDASAFLKRANKQKTITRRTGPAPSSIPSEMTGTTSPSVTQGAMGSSPVSPQFSRTRTRTPRSTNSGSMERFRPERTPRAENPLPGRTLAVRSGVPLVTPRTGMVPSVKRPNFDAIRSRKDAVVPSTYQLRKRKQRKEAARKYGGTDASERAVELALKWLASQQTKAGYWNANSLGSGKAKLDKNEIGLSGEKLKLREQTGIQADTGLTALTVLCFLGAGYTHEEGLYSENIERALRWLIQQQKKDGFLGGDSTHYAKMYCHGMVTYALAEAYGLQNDPVTDIGLRKALKKGVDYIAWQQNEKDGGWRYLKGQRSDMSMFGWQLMALKSAEIAGVPVPRKTKRLMVKFLKSRSLGKKKGLASYRSEMPISASMTAEALFCKQMLGIKRNNSASKEAVAYLMKRLPNRKKYNLYYWYYGTLAMYQYGGKPWKKWNETLRDRLVKDQRLSDQRAGSWDPVGEWGPYGGRLYSTALSTLCLEVYYRFLPLYQMGGQYEEGK
ncbi:FIG00928689: hypothetical protein [hydrothermal vent metagenome]|uniref:Squalene cyclase C-terminal domain-containing protein n=1 Tax=hydrothermal vent metagenome TaxID=652676 RepID=A0A3B1E5Z0_9ZZZZ